MATAVHEGHSAERQLQRGLSPAPKIYELYHALSIESLATLRGWSDAQLPSYAAIAIGSPLNAAAVVVGATSLDTLYAN